MEPSPPPEDESPYGGRDGFVPYTPGPTPDELRERPAGEEADEVEEPSRPPGPPVPYVPYGQAAPQPVGASAPATSYDGSPDAGAAKPSLDPISLLAAGAGVIGFSVPGLVMGVIGLVRTQGGRHRGRLAAVVGIIASLIWAFIDVVSAGFEAAVDGLTDIPVVSGDDDLSANQLVDGQCISGSGLDTGDDPVDDIHEVSCDEPHDGQVLAVNALDDDDQVTEHCDPYLTNAERELVNSADYFLIGLTEDVDPDAGDQVVCIVVLVNGDDLEKELP